ncbi:MAG: hypothetical protein KDH96_03615 [Candidatus Riesia sp.]|nr:hypothetical protein [Candidatus Riesia sp.]
MKRGNVYRYTDGVWSISISPFVTNDEIDVEHRQRIYDMIFVEGNEVRILHPCGYVLEGGFAFADDETVNPYTFCVRESNVVKYILE